MILFYPPPFFPPRRGTESQPIHGNIKLFSRQHHMTRRTMPCHAQAGVASKGVKIKLNSRGRLQARRKKQAAKRATQ